MSLIGGLTAVLVLLAGGPAAEADAPSALDTAGLVRRPIQFSAAAGDLAVEVLSGGEGCLFEGDDGRRSRRVFLVSRGGRPVAAAPVVQFETEPHDPTQPLRPPQRPVWAERHGQLPLADGAAAFEARLLREAWGPDARVSLTCTPPRPARTVHGPTVAESLAAAPVQAVGVVLFSPVILFGVPSENRSLVAAAGEGPAVADLLEPGKPVPGGLDAFARDHGGLVRVFKTPDGDYALVTVDLGGQPRYGIGTPRDAAFFGVRDGIVEWRAGRDMAVETTLCATAKGRFGGRPGCSTTGYYNPRP
jgi:hypothetical protein